MQLQLTSTRGCMIFPRTSGKSCMEIDRRVSPSFVRYIEAKNKIFLTMLTHFFWIHYVTVINSMILLPFFDSFNNSLERRVEASGVYRKMSKKERWMSRYFGKYYVITKWFVLGPSLPRISFCFSTSFICLSYPILLGYSLSLPSLKGCLDNRLRSIFSLYKLSPSIPHRSNSLPSFFTILYSSDPE